MLVDASVMEKLEELAQEFEEEGLKLELKGLDELRATSASAHAMRKRGLTPVRRITIVTDPDLTTMLVRQIVRMGATGYTQSPCVGAGRRILSSEENPKPTAQTRTEVILAPDVCEQVLEYLRLNIMPQHQLTVCVETVEVARLTSFITIPDDDTTRHTAQ